jgi:glycosyl transferase family 25
VTPDPAAVPVFVISLARAAARREQVAAEFARIGMTYRIWDGIDGAELRDELLSKTDAKAWHRNMGAPIADGHLGCYASHVELWREIASGPDPVVLICEDDVTFTDRFPQALAAGLSLAGRWDVLRFSCIRAKGRIPQARAMGFTLCAYWGPFTGNGCYLITREAAARLSARFYPIRRAHDHELNRFFAYDIRLMGLEPFTAPPRDSGESFITGSRMSGARKFPKWRRLPYYMQKLANYPRRLFWLLRKGLIWPRMTAADEVEH